MQPSPRTVTDWRGRRSGRPGAPTFRRLQDCHARREPLRRPRRDRGTASRRRARTDRTTPGGAGRMNAEATPDSPVQDPVDREADTVERADGPHAVEDPDGPPAVEDSDGPQAMESCDGPRPMEDEEPAWIEVGSPRRSEEHTSELQSRG